MPPTAAPPEGSPDWTTACGPGVRDARTLPALAQVIADKNNDIAPITQHNNCFFFHIRVRSARARALVAHGLAGAAPTGRAHAAPVPQRCGARVVAVAPLSRA